MQHCKGQIGSPLFTWQIAVNLRVYIRQYSAYRCGVFCIMWSYWMCMYRGSESNHCLYWQSCRVTAPEKSTTWSALQICWSREDCCETKWWEINIDSANFVSLGFSASASGLHCGMNSLFIGWQSRNFFISYLCRLFLCHFVGQALLNMCYCDITFIVR